MIRINMRSAANTIKGQGVGSCYEEQVSLMKSNAGGRFLITENKHGACDIAHYHTVNLNYYFERLLTRKRTMGVGYVHFLPDTLDGSLKLPKLFQAIFYRYLLRFYDSMDYLVTVNPYFIEEIRKCGVTRPEVVCIPNFVSTKVFYPTPAQENQKTRERFRIPADKFVVLAVGQLQTRKGVFDFVETAKRLPEAEFIWAGGFSFGKISEGYAEIKELMKHTPPNVRFLGIIDRKMMPALYNAADMMFLPSFDELFPMAILEAICCKKPVLVRNIALYEKILFDYCMRGGGPEEFAAGIREIMSDKGAYDQWCQRAWECHWRYSEDAALKQWVNFYEDAFACFRSGKVEAKKGIGKGLYKKM